MKSANKNHIYLAFFSLPFSVHLPHLHWLNSMQTACCLRPLWLSLIFHSSKSTVTISNGLLSALLSSGQIKHSTAPATVIVFRIAKFWCGFIFVCLNN